MDKLKAALAVYGDRRILTILLLGFSSGLPRGLIGGTLSAWLTESGVTMTSIGLIGVVAGVYSLKFLWAPLIDHLRIPLLANTLGRRRSWMLLTQVVLLVGIYLLGNQNPSIDIPRTVILALLVAVASASQDIVVDAYRVEILRPDQYGPGAASVQFGYNGAMMLTGFGGLYVAQFLSWDWVYPICAVMMLVGMATVLFNPEPQIVTGERPRDVPGWIHLAAVAPFLDMYRRHGAAIFAIAAFIILFKLGDAFAGAASWPFYLKMGFSKVDIANISKIYGVFATILGTFLGAQMVLTWGTNRTLLICGTAQMLSNLTFVYQASVGADVGVLYFTIGLENLTSGMGSAAFVAYMSALCSLTFTGTQYALLSSLALLGRNVFAGIWGAIVDQVGWINFFLFSTAAAVPGLILLLWMMRRFPAPVKASG